jgi:GT2 family glycosyltransferase
MKEIRIHQNIIADQNKKAVSVTVIIINWNSGAHLIECLSRLEQQTLRPEQVLIVDNGSQEEIIHDLEARWPRLNLVIERLASNLGFCRRQ